MESDLTGATELSKSLAALTAKSQAAARRGLARIGLVAVREAKANAPRSPTMALHSKTLKRKKRTASRKMPGGLEKSITHEQIGTDADAGVSIFVASNSYAGKYARRIHDEKGISWRKRGPGTIAKGTRADERFISRAISDNRENFAKILQSEIQKVTL